MSNMEKFSLKVNLTFRIRSFLSKLSVSFWVGLKILGPKPRKFIEHIQGLQNLAT